MLKNRNFFITCYRSLNTQFTLFDHLHYFNSRVETLKFCDSRNREKFKTQENCEEHVFKSKNVLMWVFTREPLANFCKSADISEFLVLLAKFRKI